MSERHSRHERFAPIGREGQLRIEKARVAVVGCGALGSRSAELLGRAGVGRAADGFLRLIDRDYVEISNLQRQALYTEDDARRARPKASAAATHLRAIDEALQVDSVVRDFNRMNARELLRDVDLVIDGTDNFRTRFLLNDIAIDRDIPWIYGGAVGSRGAVAFIAPPKTPCIRCYLEAAPPLGVTETCDTTGIITPLPSLVSALQVTLALRHLVDDSISAGLTMFDSWNHPGESRRLLEGAKPLADCPSCGLRELPALSDSTEDVVSLCGRNSVQLSGGVAVSIDDAAARFGSVASIERNPHSLTATIAEGRLTLFDDGRIIVEGTTDAIEAKSIVARYLA